MYSWDSPQTTDISCSFANLKCKLIQIAERKFAMGQWFEFKEGHQKKISSNFIAFDYFWVKHVSCNHETCFSLGWGWGITNSSLVDCQKRKKWDSDKRRKLPKLCAESMSTRRIFSREVLPYSNGSSAVQILMAQLYSKYNSHSTA